MNTCKSPATKTGYAKALKYFIGYLGIPVNGYIQLLRKDPKLMEINLRDFILYLKKGHSSATVSLYLAGIRKFYDMNHVVLNWKWIRSFEGEKEKLAEDRPYTHEEIRMLVSSKHLGSIIYQVLYPVVVYMFFTDQTVNLLLSSELG